MTADDERRFAARQQFLFALWKEVILCRSSSVMVPVNHLQAVAAGVGITKLNILNTGRSRLRRRDLRDLDRPRRRRHASRNRDVPWVVLH